MEFFLSKRGKEMISHDGYLYNIERIRNNGKVFRCNLRNCYGKLIIDSENKVLDFKTHNHERQQNKIKCKHLLNEIKESAQLNAKLPFDVITKVTSKLKEDEILELPLIRTIRDDVIRRRNKQTSLINCDYKEIPESLRYTLDKTQFFRFDSGYNDNNRVIIFYSEFSESVLKVTETVLIDGTFKSCPNYFFQLVTLHGFFLGRIILWHLDYSKIKILNHI